MSLKKIKKEAETLLYNNWTTTPIAWANVGFDETPDSYLQCFILPVDNERQLVSADDPFLVSAIFQINIKVKMNLGTAIHFDYEETLINLFREKNINGVVFRRASSGAVFQDGEYYVLPLAIECDCLSA